MTIECYSASQSETVTYEYISLSVSIKQNGDRHKVNGDRYLAEGKLGHAAGSYRKAAKNYERALACEWPKMNYLGFFELDEKISKKLSEEIVKQILEGSACCDLDCDLEQYQLGEL